MSDEETPAGTTPAGAGDAPGDAPDTAAPETPEAPVTPAVPAAPAATAASPQAGSSRARFLRERPSRGTLLILLAALAVLWIGTAGWAFLGHNGHHNDRGYHRPQMGNQIGNQMRGWGDRRSGGCFGYASGSAQQIAVPNATVAPSAPGATNVPGGSVLVPPIPNGQRGCRMMLPGGWSGSGQIAVPQV